MKKRLILLFACALCLGVCLLGRHQFYLGAALFLTRWPLALLGLLLAISFVRARRFAFAALAVALPLVAAAQSLSSWMDRARPAPLLGPSRELTVVTHNVLFRGANAARSISAIREQKPDVIALQEVTPEWLELLDAAFGADFAYRAAAPMKGTLGYAVYSRVPLSNVALLGEASRAFAQCMDLELPDGPIALCNVHLYSPAAALFHERNVPLALAQNARTRREQWQRVSAHLDARARGTRRIVAGDFNTSEMDPLLADIAERYVDAWRSTRLSPGFTFPNVATGTPPLVRIDYVMTRGPIRPVSAEVLQKSGSDHFPLVARLEIGTGSRRVDPRTAGRRAAR
jgi:vancomycin resistance protein VanJ